MQAARASPTWRPFVAALLFATLLVGLFWLRPGLGRVEFVVGLVLFLGLATVLPICLLILVGRPPKPRVLPKRQAIAPLLVAACGLLLVLGLLWASGEGVDSSAVAVLVGVLGAVLVFDISLCVLILVGYPPTMTLAPLFRTRSERAKWRQMRRRPLLSDDEFFERFYSGTSIPRDIPLRLRRIYAEQLGMDRVEPSDVAAEFDSEIDLMDLLDEVEEEFGVAFSIEEAHQLAGSFDSVARAVAAKLGKLSSPAS